MKGITSEMVASPCLLKLVNGGQIQMLNKSEPQQFSQYTAHFVADNVNQQTQSCNYVTFVPMGEEAPLQVHLFLFLDLSLDFCHNIVINITSWDVRGQSGSSTWEFLQTWK